MIETNTLIRWTRDMVDFANGEVPTDGNTIGDAFLRTYGPPEKLSRLRNVVRRHCAMLTRPLKSRKDPDRKLILAARRLLHDANAPGIHDDPTTVQLSISDSGELQTKPMFAFADAQFAAVFAELIGPKAPALIKQCRLDTCQKFFVFVLGGRGRPRESFCCDAHANTHRTHKHRATLRKEKK
jgi:hypothetical protein